MTIAIPQSITLRVPLALVDDPKVAMRTDMRDEDMEALMHSIRDNGLLQAIGVKPTDAAALEILKDRIARDEAPFRDGAIRVEVVYGHRRTIAHRFLEATDIEAKIFLDLDVQPEAFKVAENLDREDTNAASEARFLSDLLKTIANNDVEELCRIVRRSFEWVSARLNLFTGDERVFRAIEAGEISFSVGRELNRITSPHVLGLYLEQAKNTGCSTASARQWRIEANQTGHFVDAALAAQPAGGVDGAPIPSHAPVCICCGLTKDPYEMSLVYLHGYCKKAILDPLLGRVEG